MNLFRLIYWVLDPQKAVDYANGLLTDIKNNKGDRIKKTKSIGYLNEFFSKYLAYGKSNQEIVLVNQDIDKKKKTNDKIANALIELRKIRLEIKKMSNDQNDQIIKTVKTFGVSSGIVRGTALNITSEKQAIPKGCIGIFPTSGTKHTRQFSKCAGIIFANGGMTSHGAIFTREFNIPAAVSPRLKIPDGTNVLIDGSTGKIIISGTFDRSS